MKVSELIEVLKGYPADAVVVGGWDAQWSNIDDHSLNEDRNGNKVVELDVEIWNSYQP